MVRDLRGLRFAVAVVALSVAALVGCNKNQSLALVGGRRVEASALDGNPLALLPKGPLILYRLDAARLFASSFGRNVAALTATLLPIGPESNFVPARDVQRITGAVYAMQGADFCAVLQGNFDVARIRAAAAARAQTPGGAPLVRTEYAGNEIFTVANLGFVLLTPRAILSGNETGMRRALDRLRFGRVDHELPAWMHIILNDERAAFGVVSDMSGQPAVAAAQGELPFVAGLRYVRVLGNFEPPGSNIVGTLTYGDGDAAVQGAEQLRNVARLNYVLGVFSAFGFGGRPPELTVALAGRDVGFATSLDGSMVGFLIDMASQLTRSL
ncbi:MAG: hypothetical protein IT373_19155 [Polyangiaceae bacterium]|nr:hypothetical protein [Polyangiaceae bacterium]